jgi:trk system potassium uptake protein TrkH
MTANGASHHVRVPVLTRRRERRSSRRRRTGAGSWWTGGLRNPARAVAIGFLLSITIGTALLMLPLASHAPGSVALLTALFTATSAVCVTGLITVDTATTWTTFGESVLIVLMQVGGLGIMIFASLLTLMVLGRLGLHSRLLASAETGTLEHAATRRVLAGIVRISLTIEAIVWVLLTLRLWLHYDESPPRAAYLALFHTVSAYNNAGFALWSDSLISVAGDPWIITPIAAAFILGGLGYPVLLEVMRRRVRLSWLSLHTKLTLVTTAVLLVLGPIVITATEWSNPATLGSLPVDDRLLSGWFSGVSPRTAGFNSIDYAHAEPATLFSTIMLMLIGGGSAGTAGGIKVTTLAVLAVAVMAEVRGDPDVDAYDRRISDATVRQAMAIAALATVAVATATFALLELTDLQLHDALFEATSALATVGLSTGVTADIPDGGQLLLVALMFLGRIGPITAATALALRPSRRLYRNPEARPIVG